jgi:hypothetical protein
VGGGGGGGELNKKQDILQNYKGNKRYNEAMKFGHGKARKGAKEEEA